MLPELIRKYPLTFQALSESETQLLLANQDTYQAWSIVALLLQSAENQTNHEIQTTLIHDYLLTLRQHDSEVMNPDHQEQLEESMGYYLGAENWHTKPVVLPFRDDYADESPTEEIDIAKLDRALGSLYWEDLFGRVLPKDPIERDLFLAPYKETLDIIVANHPAVSVFDAEEKYTTLLEWLNKTATVDRVLHYFSPFEPNVAREHIARLLCLVNYSSDRHQIISHNGYLLLAETMLQLEQRNFSGLMEFIQSFKF